MSELSPSGGSEGYEACGDDEDDEAPETFRQRTLLSQHISFLKDFFRSYKDFTDAQIDTIELMLGRLYAKWGMDDSTDFTALSPGQFPILSDLYDVIEGAYENYGDEAGPLYPRELLREILLGLHSLCRGAESKFFNGHTNITSSRFLVFGVKGLLQASKNVKDAMLFNVLAYLSDKLLTVGNTVATLDELYIAKEIIKQCTNEQIAAAPPYLLELFAQDADFHTLSALVEKGISGGDSAARTLHMLTCEGRNSWMAEELLEKRMWVDPNNYGALHACVENGAVNVAKLLLDGGMDFDQYRQRFPGIGSPDTIQALEEHWQTIQEQAQELEQEQADAPEMGGGMTLG